MVGDGLDDAPALAAAYASISPATATRRRRCADAVFSDALMPVVGILRVARRADRLVRRISAWR
jgi:Cu2+-exporting ATPase